MIKEENECLKTDLKTERSKIDWNLKCDSRVIGLKRNKAGKDQRGGKGEFIDLLENSLGSLIWEVHKA